MNYTSHLLKSQNNLISPQEPLDDGLKKVKLNTSDPMQELEEVNDCISLTILKKSLESPTKQSLPKQPSVMLESVQIIKKKILNDKSLYLKKSTPIQKSSKILDLVSIGNDQDLVPFWNKSTLEMSQKLWLPTKTECVDLDMNLLNGSSKRLMLKSWFSAQVITSLTCLESSQMTYLQSLQSLLPKITDLEQLSSEKNGKSKKTTKENLQKFLDNETLENKKEREAKYAKKLEQDKKKSLKEPAASTVKIKIYPTNEQKQTLASWFGVHRWVCNKCIYTINKRGKKIPLKELRKLIINNENFENENTWMKSYEYDLRDEALRDVLKNIKSNEAKGKQFELKFKTKKTNSR